MFKNIKIYSLVALATLVLVGCGGSSDSNANSSSSTPATIKKFSQGVENLTDAEKLAYAVANQNKLPTGKSNKKRSRDLQNCTNGGTMDMVFDPQNLTQMSIVFDNCAEDGEISNGTMKLDGMSENGEPTKITFVTDFKVTGDENVFVKKGGTMQRIKEGIWEKMIINVEMTVNGVTHGGENLIYKGKESQDGSFIEFPISGKEKIGNSAYFTVDTSYDASATPFKEDKDGNLQKGGLFKYKDKNNHKVELEVTDTNVVTVRVDSDGDGSFSSDEISAVDLVN